MDKPLHFHGSFSALLHTFQNIITGISWLKVSINIAEDYYKRWPYTIMLASSVTDENIKIDKTIISLIKEEGLIKETPLYAQTLINSYRIFSIAIKDIIWEEPDFSSLHNKTELQFLRHIRNASAHNNRFYWGTGRQRTETIKNLPVQWRGKEINVDMENKELYMSFFAPGDLFILLSDISELYKNKN